MSTKDYDESELRKYVFQTFLSLAVIGFLHYKWELMPPLVVQCFMNPMNLYNVYIYFIFTNYYHQKTYVPFH